ncbi:hypothetical protein QYE76_052731 [Lolium multiflorum]|uniref:Protein FAR1-RELATED SEQUENCE n=1 Tax=Lolium multiflorum TaxID=4521 RepID=A0AAD8SUL8_LOLMU|nr:hypothetical protein QYE76_052731 [Lolium multiflorum]
MRVAIDSELPDTRHRWCKWHVLRKAKESLGPVYSKNSVFKRELHELLDQIVDVEEFEMRWAEIVTGNGLGDNEFLARAYENREMWAKPYFSDTFCAGMTSTQRSESANHVLKTYIPRHVLKVLVHTGACELPAGLLKKRWSISARDGAVCNIPGYGDAAARGADAASMHGMLHAAAMELVGMGTNSRQAFEIAVDYISHAKAAVSVITVKDPVQSLLDAQNAPACGMEKLNVDPSVAAPPRVRSRGRPKELRYKSPIESPGSRKRAVADSSRSIEDDRPRRSSRFLKTGVYIVEHCGSCGSTQHRSSECSVNLVPEEFTATRRRCKSCGEIGHNRSTCGRKSTYTPKM